MAVTKRQMELFGSGVTHSSVCPSRSKIQLAKKIAQSVLLILMFVTAANGQAPTANRPRQSISPTPTNSPAPLTNNANSASVNSSTATESGKSEKVRWTDLEAIIPIIGFSLQLIISAVGFGLVVWQISLLNRGIQGDTHSRLYDHYLKVNDLLSKKPELRPYFYDGKSLEASHPKHADMLAEIQMMSEVILGLLEHAAVQKDNLPPDSWANCWSNYTDERFQKSPELKKFFKDNHQWYALSFCEVIRGKFPELLKPAQPTSATAKVEGEKSTLPQTPEAPVNEGANPQMKL
jgi:hypothetical protein